MFVGTAKWGCWGFGLALLLVTAACRTAPIQPLDVAQDKPFDSARGLAQGRPFDSAQGKPAEAAPAATVDRPPDPAPVPVASPPGPPAPARCALEVRNIHEQCPVMNPKAVIAAIKTVEGVLEADYREKKFFVLYEPARLDPAGLVARVRAREFDAHLATGEPQ